MKFALGQTEGIPERIDKNINRMPGILAVSKDQSVDLVVLTEFCTGKYIFSDV